MNPKLNQPWIPFERIEAMIQLEPAFFLLGLSVVTWLIYRIFLHGVSADRHRNLRRLFLNLGAHFAVFAVLFGAYMLVHSGLMDGLARGVGMSLANERLASYLGISTLISGAIVFVKVSRILMFEYLFLGHMREGVPLLIVNLFSLLLSIGIAGWFATEIFGIKLAPLLATSAVFSLIMGLALQDTLGNLFAGVALQLDKPYEIGDWIEVVQGGSTWVGQVEEISWRATTLIGLWDELLILPNRVMATAEISNFSARNSPIWRAQAFRIPYTADLADVKKVIARAVANVDGVRTSPPPFIWIRETTESWVLFRCSYTIDDYSHQFRIGSNVITAVVEELKKSGYANAAQRVQLVADPSAPPNSNSNFAKL